MQRLSGCETNRGTVPPESFTEAESKYLTEPNRAEPLPWLRLVIYPIHSHFRILLLVQRRFLIILILLQVSVVGVTVGGKRLQKN